MKQTITSKTGSAPVVRQGHTSDGRYGTSLTAKVKGATSSRDNTRS